MLIIVIEHENQLSFQLIHFEFMQQIQYRMLDIYNTVLADNTTLNFQGAPAAQQWRSRLKNLIWY
jgi:hypothetical protein